jgi:hypothetical protein
MLPLLSSWGAAYCKNTCDLGKSAAYWPKKFIKASGPSHPSFAVRSGAINEKNAKNPSMGPSVSFYSNTEAKKIMFSAQRSFTVYRENPEKKFAQKYHSTSHIP